MAFLSKGYLLSSPVARSIFEEIAKLPIVDLHTHVEPERIAENQGWEDIWEAEGAADHYVWSLMRRMGVPEDLITGQASSKDKWAALAQVLPKCGGNPVYEWIHFDLRRFLKIEDVVGPNTAELIWEKAKQSLLSSQLRPWALLKEMNVEVLCTTDSPVSDLGYHQKIASALKDVKILPTWRPDTAMYIGTEKSRNFLRDLSQRFDQDISSLPDFLHALERSHDYFALLGCRISDHGLDMPPGRCPPEKRVQKIFDRALRGLDIGRKDALDFRSFLLYFFAELDINKKWLMQLHIGAVRDYRDVLLRSLGADSGGDVASHAIELVSAFRSFLNAFDGRLQVILYVLHPSHTFTVATLARAFPGVLIGAPWWFMDNPYHIRSHLYEVSSVDLLWQHAGMVSDARKLFAVGARAEMFRRILSSFLGELVEQERLPLEEALQLGKRVAYMGPKELVLHHL